jgi:hypothetical protein
VTSRGGKGFAFRGLVEKFERTRNLGRHRYRREDNIKRIYQQIGWGDLNWIYVGQEWSKLLAVVKREMDFVFHKLRGN